ncbi:MAG: preprotein translocase subunit SecG [Ignavibacteriales bacterium]|nr:preprotein translocase subunit SecG [Ignavibacteriales bacterium]
MYSILVSVTVLIAIMLIVIVLLQASKGGGLAGTFGGAQIGTMFGSRRTADFLSKATWWLAGTLVVLTLLINLFFLPTSAGGDRESVIQSRQQSVPTQPSLPQQAPKK